MKFHSRAHDDSIAARGARYVFFLVTGARARAIVFAIAAAGTAAVNLNTVTLARDAVALARAATAV